MKDNEVAGEHLSVPRSSVQRAKQDGGLKGTQKPGKPGVGALETAVTVEFFENNTFVRSGAKTCTRRMALRQSEMYALYRAHFPMIVRRAESLADGGMYGPLSAFLSTQLIRAKEMSEVEGWRPVDELNGGQSGSTGT